MMSFGAPPLTRGVKYLGIATLALSVAAALSKPVAALAFVPQAVLHLELWRPFTYTFLEPEPFNLVFSLLGLWLIGAPLEQRWGMRRFLVFYFVSGALAAAATLVVGLFAPTVMGHVYFGDWPVLEAMIAAIALLTPDATFFLIIFPVQARWMLPISAGITLLYMVMEGWQAFLPNLLGLGAGALLAGGFTPGHFWLRARVWWIDRRLRRSNLRIVRGVGDDKRGARGSDKYLH